MTAATADAIEAAHDRRAFTFIFVTTFIAILAIALVAQALTLRWRAWFPGAESTTSLVGGVRAASSSLMSLLI